jgi:putative transposase
MPKRRFTEPQIVAILREADADLTVGEICRKHAITKNTFYRWRKLYGSLDVDQARELKRLREENAKMKKKLAEMMLEIDDIRFLLSKKW